MIGAALGLVILPYSCLLAVGIPLMLALLFPPEETRLMNPLIGASAQHQRILLPDTAARKLEACLLDNANNLSDIGIYHA